jgi:hypothetical protein
VIPNETRLENIFMTNSIFYKHYRNSDVNREESRNGQRETVSKEWIDCPTTRSVSGCSVGRTQAEHADPERQAGLLFVLGLCLVGFCWSGIARGEEQPEAADGRELSLTATDVAGVTHRIRYDKPSVATVVVFLSTECPIARSYLPALNELSRQWQQLDPPVKCFGVISDRSVTRAIAMKFVSDFRVEFPVLFDTDGELASSLKPTHIPEVFVVARSGVIA